MAYQLQPDLQRLEHPATPSVCADDTIFVYPQPANLNYCCRPNTMVYGTAPYMAGKGAPADLVMVADELRPQSTDRHDRRFVNSLKKDTFPWQNMGCSLPLRTKSYDPINTRAQLQNGLFNKRYCN